MQKQLDTLFANLAELAAAVKANTDAITILQGGTVDQPEPEEYPEYIQPAGAHDAYNTGDKVTYDGRHYICQLVLISAGMMVKKFKYRRKYLLDFKEA